MTKPYSTDIEKKYTRKELKAAIADYERRVKRLDLLEATQAQRKHASLSQVARDHGIGRTTLTTYRESLKRKKKDGTKK